MKEISEIEIKAMSKEQNYLSGYADGRSDMLDQIRVEIEHLTYYWCEVNPRTVIDDVLQIIDKYKAESEDKE